MRDILLRRVCHLDKGLSEEEGKCDESRERLGRKGMRGVAINLFNGHVVLGVDLFCTEDFAVTALASRSEVLVHLLELL